MYGFSQNPFQRVIQESGIIFELSQDLTSIAFLKQAPFAVLEQVDGKWMYWTDSSLQLDGIKYQYRQFHNLENNVELKKYLTIFLGYDNKEKENESD
jgi:hypothetical protein